MITITLLVALGLLAIILGLVFGLAGLMVFGDIIIAALIIYWIVKQVIA